MTTIIVTTTFGKWDEAARQLGRLGFTLTIENTIEVPNGLVQSALIALWGLAAGSVISAFSVDAENIRASTS